MLYYATLYALLCASCPSSSSDSRIGVFVFLVYIHQRRHDAEEADVSVRAEPGDVGSAGPLLKQPRHAVVKATGHDNVRQPLCMFARAAEQRGKGS